MAHVTFIHGIANKPAESDLVRIWREGLRLPRAPEHPDAPGADDRLDLGAQGISSSMVYWADVLYQAPDPNIAAHESTDTDVAELEAFADDATADFALQDIGDIQEQEWVERLAAQFHLETQSPGGEDFEPPIEAADGSFERVPLPWFIKRRFMKRFLRDVHHYLFDVEHSVRDETFRVRQTIRKRFCDKLRDAEVRGHPHVVISHSMGTVIAYDCLKNVEDCPSIDALITLGSPLGLDEVQDRLAPGWSRTEGFPSEKVKAEWVNIYDPLDVVCALDPKLSNDFKRERSSVVTDIREENYGKWRHSLRKYFQGPQLRSELQRLLNLSN